MVCQRLQIAIAVAFNVLHLRADFGAGLSVPLHLNRGQQPRRDTRWAVLDRGVVRRMAAHAEQPVLSTDAACTTVDVHSVRPWCWAEILARPDWHVVATDVTVSATRMRKHFVNLCPECESVVAGCSRQRIGGVRETGRKRQCDQRTQEAAKNVHSHLK